MVSKRDDVLKDVTQQIKKNKCDPREGGYRSQKCKRSNGTNVI
jgi:hypothetical protein